MPVRYSDGKVIDQILSIMKLNLQTAKTLSKSILATGHMSDEINLLAVLADVNQEFQQISNLLFSINPTEPTKAGEVSAQARLFTDMPMMERLNTLYLEVYNYVVSRADDMESMNCRERNQ